MSQVSVINKPVDVHQRLTERLAARALRLALDPCAEARDGAIELAVLAGGSPRHLVEARRRLRCGDKRGRSRIVARADQLLSAALLSAQLWNDRLAGPPGGPVASISPLPHRGGARC